MRKLVKCGIAVGLSIALGTVGSLSIVSGMLPYKTNVEAAVDNGESAKANGIDILDYEENKSATEFVINDIAGMEKLAELAKSNSATHYDLQHKTVRLNKDLKYDGTKNNYTIIEEFMGNFDGGYHTISGVNIDSDAENVGLFGTTGSVCNLILRDSVIIGGNKSFTGGIIGKIGGQLVGVKNCVVGSDVKIEGSAAGGIAGASYYDITRCINFGKVTGSTAGGITALQSGNRGMLFKQCVNYGEIKGEICGGINGSDSGTYEECCNFGNIISESWGSSLAGGIIGWSDLVKIVNCFNAGKISTENPSSKYKEYHGGIFGNADVTNLQTYVNNSYSVGKVQDDWSGAITSVYQKESNLSKCYWLTGSADTGVNMEGADSGIEQDISSVYEYSQSQMHSQEFVDELNSNSKALGRGEVWIKDTMNKNNGYPILKDVPYTIDDIINSSGDNNDKDDPYLPDEDDDPVDTTPVSHFYEDHNYAEQATNATVRVYANGGVVAVLGTTEKKNYKRCVLYTDITPSYIYTVGKNGAVKPSAGKVVVGITSSNVKPDLAKNKIVDKSVSKIASASIKNGQITVTAKSQPGKVYLWVIDTGRVGESACIPVTVKAAPTATNIYAVPDTDSSFTYGKTKQFKSGKISVGESAKVYLYPTYKENGAVQKTKKVSYTASVAAKSADYFSVKQSDSNPLCFEISAKSLKSGKSVTGTITFTCSLNGKKVAFKATAINQVTGISTANVSGMTKESDSSFKIKASDSEKTTGTFEMQTVCSSNTDAMTDILKIYAMGSADGYDTAQFEAGKVKITKKRSGVQSKISMKPAKDKKTVIVTAAKGTKPVTAYFLAVYNNVNSGLKKGYMVISVTAE